MGTCLGKERSISTLEKPIPNTTPAKAEFDNGYLTLPRKSSTKRNETQSQSNPVFTQETYDGDEPDGQLSSVDTSHGDEIKAMVGVYRQHIEDSVNVDDILLNLEHYIEDCAAIRNQHSNRNSMRCLIDAINDSEEPGKWQAFMDALDRGGYPYIVGLLNGHTQRDLSTRKKLLQHHKQVLKENMHLDTCLDKLLEKDVINEQDMDRIKCARNRHSEERGCLVLLDCIPNRVENWFEKFIEVLRACDMGYIADRLYQDETQIAPPSKCPNKPSDGSNSSYLKKDLDQSTRRHAATPPPEYHNDKYKIEHDRNESKIQKLGGDIKRKNKILEQRGKLRELRQMDKELNEKLEDDVPDDDSSSETSLKDGWLLMNNSPSQYERFNDTTDARLAEEPEKGEKKNHNMSNLLEQRDRTYQNRTLTATITDMQHEIDQLKKSIAANLHPQHPPQPYFLQFSATIADMQHGINQLKKRIEILHSHKPPQPHNMLIADSAFSDCSFISTSL